jgi:hypothetical protein
MAPRQPFAFIVVDTIQTRDCKFLLLTSHDMQGAAVSFLQGKSRFRLEDCNPDHSWVGIPNSSIFFDIKRQVQIAPNLDDSI